MKKALSVGVSILALAVVVPASAQQSPSPAPQAAAPAAAKPAYEAGLIGTVYSPSIGGAASTLLWEYPIEGSRWPFASYAKHAPSQALQTALPAGFVGALDITTPGQWGIRLRRDGQNECRVTVKLEGTDILAGALNDKTPALQTSANLPDVGLYELAGKVECAKVGDTLALEVLPPGQTVWAPAVVRRPARPLASASVPTAASGANAPVAGGVVTIRKGAGAGGPKWLQQVKAVSISIDGPTGNLSSAIDGDTVAEIPHNRPDAIAANTYSGARPEFKYDSTKAQHRSTFTTLQTVPEAGRWYYFVALEQPAGNTRLGNCRVGLDVEGHPVIAASNLGVRFEEIGGDQPGSWATIGAADLAAGEYKATINAGCVRGQPEMVRVWVKGPKDSALRPLKPEEASVKVAQ